MAKFNKTDYRAVYPGVEISDEIISFLNRSDHKMFHLEHEIKEGVIQIDVKTEMAVFIPGREDSIERLIDEKGIEFQAPLENVADEALENIMVEKLRKCMRCLTGQEIQLVYALYGLELSEHQFSARTGVAQQTIHDRKVRILRKLKKLLER